MRTFWLLSLFFILPSEIIASSAVWSIVLRDGKVYSNVDLKRVTGDSVLVVQRGSLLEELVIDSIHTVKNEESPEIFPTVVGVAAVGVAAGLMVGPKDDFIVPARALTAIVGGVAGGLVGWLVASVSSKTEVYGLTTILNHQAKAELLRRLISRR